MRITNTIRNTIKELRGTTSSKAKREILDMHYHNTDLQTFFAYTYNPYYTYGVTTSTLPKLESTEGEGNFPAMIELLDSLRNRDLTGNSARDAIISFTKTYPATAELLYLALDKDAKAGITETTLNKTWSKLIPVFSIAKAEPYTGNLSYPALAEVKMDGVRVIAIITDSQVQLYSSNGREAQGLDSLKAELRNATKNYPHTDLVLDGELTSSNRRSVSGIFNKALKGTIATADEADLVFTAFDIMPLAEWNNQRVTLTAKQRREQLESYLSTSQQVQLVTAKWVSSESELMEFFNEIYQRGDEGIIVKAPDSLYAFKRDSAWQKLKGILDCDLVVTGFTEGTGKREGLFGAMICESADGKLKVQVGSGFTDSNLKCVNANRGAYIGRVAKVRYNGIITAKDSDTYSLFLPRFIDFREDKTEADTLQKIMAEGNKGQL